MISPLEKMAWAKPRTFPDPLPHAHHCSLPRIPLPVIQKPKAKMTLAHPPQQPMLENYKREPNWLPAQIYQLDYFGPTLAPR